MDEYSEKLYDCDSCFLKNKCQVDRVCLQCGDLKKSSEWCIKNSEILCVSCFEEGNYKPLCLIKKDK